MVATRLAPLAPAEQPLRRILVPSTDPSPKSCCRASSVALRMRRPWNAKLNPYAASVASAVWSPVHAASGGQGGGGGRVGASHQRVRWGRAPQRAGIGSRERTPAPAPARLSLRTV